MDRATQAWWIVVAIMSAACIALVARAMDVGAALLIAALPAVAVADLLWFRRNRP